jgi:tetratricopeptide (TPR) repeat protein
MVSLLEVILDRKAHCKPAWRLNPTVGRLAVAKRKSDRMKTYRDEGLGFEIDVPEEWSLPTRVAPDSLKFDGVLNETLNFAIGPLLPERLLEYTELEFRLYAHNKRYTDLEFGRISVGGRDHVWARYHMGHEVWTKKYMIVFGGIEYAITATCFDQQTFAEREKVWDAIVTSFRLRESRERSIRELQAQRRETAGPLYEKAYEAVAEGRYSEARALLERCLCENPNHILAHKELAVVLRQLGDIRGALGHRREVKRLDPSDTLNRFNIAVLLNVLGARDEALREAEELLEMEPNNREFQALKTNLGDKSLLLTYPQHYEQESERVPGNRRYLRLIDSSVEDGKYGTLIRLVYQWDTTMSYEEAFRLDLRARAYIACAIYDAAITAGLFCQASEMPHGRRPAWLIEGERIPISLINTEFNFLDSICIMEIGPSFGKSGTPQDGGVHWAKLLTGFKVRFIDITV